MTFSQYPGSLIDAIRIVDGRRVYLKRVSKSSTEYSIALWLASPPRRDDPCNHTMPILEVLDDDEDEDSSYLVTPLLRNIDDPAFETVDNAMDFVDQTIEVRRCSWFACALR